ncbi:putative motility protein [Clostridium butyricum]|uniref:YjfB family protein n=1 Tax=Clostridium butyricum TaxID=1492 RepID=UPI000F52DCEA|nr:YjfB family protein [Clostridium butyricum]RQN12292.1 putative motility protein [Clostridium butyricum]
MDIAQLSMIMSQSKAQTAAGIAIAKMAMDTNKETGTQMKKIAQQAKHGNLTEEELKVLNTRINDLVMQIRAIDSESRRIEEGRILE